MKEMYDAIHMKCPEQANLWMEIDWWLLEDGEGLQSLFLE